MTATQTKSEMLARIEANVADAIRRLEVARRWEQEARDDLDRAEQMREMVNTLAG